MIKDYKIRAPFFEIGPKAFLWGKKMLEFALEVDKAAAEYDVDVIITPQYTDIPMLAKAVKHLHIFAQHIDPIVPGRGLGSVLPEAVREAGAIGTMLNHAERKLERDTLRESIRRAHEVGLATIVCADTLDELKFVASLSPNLLVAEPTALIGSGTPSSLEYVKDSIDMVKSINPEIMVLQGAGISNADDVYNVIYAGAEATGSTSGIMKAENPAQMARQMLAALRRAWDDRNS